VETLRTTGAKVAYTDSMRVVEEERQGKWVEVSRELAMSNDFDRQRFLTDNLTPINNVMHERLCWEVADHHDETLPVLEDWEFWIRLSRRWDFVHIPKATAEVRWRANGENITFQGRDLFPGCRLRIAAKVAALLEAEAPLEPALPDGFLFQPDWTRAEWLEILLAYISAFTPGEPVCLLFILDTTQMTLEKAQEMILDMVRRTGHQVFPDVELVDKPGEMFSILQRLRSAQWVPAGRNGMAALEGLNGRRFALARERFRT